MSIHGGLNQKRSARLVPPGEVIEVFILAIFLVFERRLVGGEEDGYSAVELFRQGFAAGVVDGGGLALEGMAWRS